MIRFVGSCPRIQAVKPMEAVSDFIERGGTFRINRRSSLRATRVSCQHT